MPAARQGRFALAAPYDMEMSLRFACSPPRAAAHLPLIPAADHWRGREYRRVVWLDSSPVLLRLKSDGLVDRPQVRWWAEGNVGAGAEAMARHLLSADLDLTACYAAFAGDAVLSGLSRQFHGLKMPQYPSLYECLISAILEQQLNFTFAHQLKRRLLEHFGPRIEWEGETYFGYPAPADLARVQPAQLRALQVSGPKAGYVLGVARAFAGGEIDEEQLRALSAEAAGERLKRLAGIGAWTASYALLRGLGHSDALPAGDVGLQRAVTHLYGLRGRATPLAIVRRWRRLAPWRGYATFYAWYTLW